MNIVLAIIVLSIIIIIHELGHFMMAKANGVMVLEFAIGFGPKLIHFKKNETEYSIKLLPFGGACIMLGEDMADNELSVKPEDSGQYDMTRSFGAKSVWARISILAAGPVFNFILAFILAVVIIGIIGYDPCSVDVVKENSPAAYAGLKEGDLITHINGKKVTFSRDLSLVTLMHPEQKLEIVYKRDGKSYETSVTPEYNKKTAYMTGITILGNAQISSVENDSPAKQGGIKVNDIITSINSQTVSTSDDVVRLITESQGETLSIMVNRDGNNIELSVTPVMKESESYNTGLYSYGQRVKANAVKVPGYAFKEVGYWIRTVFGSLGMMFRGQVTLDDVSGPVGVVSAIGNVVEQSKPDGMLYVFLNLLNMTVMISANLGVMNLLPFPALDGGRLLFAFIEILRGRPISREKEGMVHFVGIVLLMILMVVVMFNDISNLF